MADGASLPSASSNKPLITPLTLAGSGFSTAVPSSVEATDDVIPPVHTHRTLVLCFDGTGDQFDTDVSSPQDTPTVSFDDALSQNSNIIQFFSMLKKDDPSQQMVYYQVGCPPHGNRCVFDQVVYFGRLESAPTLFLKS